MGLNSTNDALIPSQNLGLNAGSECIKMHSNQPLVFNLLAQRWEFPSLTYAAFYY
jgi:hypothetical protein